MKKNYRVIVALSLSAHEAIAKKGAEKLIKSRSKTLKKGYDYKVKDFFTEEAAEAYTQGLEDGNGWLDEPAWEIKEL